MYFVYLPGLQLAGLIISIELIYESYKIDLCRYRAGNDSAVNDRIFNSESNYSMKYGSTIFELARYKFILKVVKY